MKIKLFETSNDHLIRYEVWEGKKKINGGWYKFSYGDTKGQMAKKIKAMFLTRTFVTGKRVNSTNLQTSNPALRCNTQHGK